MSYYFNSVYPTIDYDPSGNGITTKIQDIFIRVIARKEVMERNVLFSKYTVKDAESPEMLAKKVYGSVKYYWVILLTNKIFDRYYEWPMTERNLKKYISDKYENPAAIHHYEISQFSGDTNTKIKVELADEPTASAISNYEYEVYLNDLRKEIKILDRAFLSQFEDEYLDLIKESTL